MKRIPLSLKSKILLGIIFLLGATVCFNLFYSITLFKNDKKAYIFENALKRASTLDEQIYTELVNFKKMSYMMSLIGESKYSDLKNQLSDSKSIDFSFELLQRGKEFEYLSFVTYKPTNFLLGKHTIPELKEIFSEMILRDIIKVGTISLLDFNGNNYFAYAIKNEFNNNLYVTMFEATKIMELLKSDQYFKNTLLWKKEKGYKSIPMQSMSREMANLLDKKEMGRGAIEEEISDRKYILGFSKNKELDFVITTSIPYDTAFEITYYLILKTMIWAAVLVGFFTIFGVLFSASIVSPIKKLTDVAKKIADGELDVEIKIKSNDEFKTLADAFEYMISRVKSLLHSKQLIIEDLKVASSKLSNLNKDLENIVKERTKELNTSNLFMQAMVNSLNQGMVVFDRDLKCNKIHTEATAKILEKDPNGLYFYDLLDLDEHDLSALQDWAMITFDGLIPFESAAPLAPSNKKWGNSIYDPDYKFVTLEYFPMLNAEGKLQNIVAVSTDKTLELQATEKFKESRAHVAMLIKVISNKKQFTLFLKEIKSILESIQSSLYNPTEGSHKTLMMLFHTLNGGFGLYQMLDLQARARACEVEVDKIVNQTDPSMNTHYFVLMESYNKLEKAFSDKIQEIEKILGLNFSEDIIILEVSNKEIAIIKEKISSLPDKGIMKWFEDVFVKENLYDYLKGYASFIEYESKKIGKEVEELEIVHNDIKLNMKPFQEFFSTLIHVFRNSLDHGLEDSETRVSLGKSEKGKISIDANFHSQELVLKVSDNGSGINIEKIKNKLLSIDYSIEGLSESDLLNVIFQPFFSTKDEVSALSGRGVGMSSVKEAIEKVGGSIEIITKQNIGTTFIFKLPLMNH